MKKTFGIVQRPSSCLITVGTNGISKMDKNENNYPLHK